MSMFRHGKGLAIAAVLVAVSHAAWAQAPLRKLNIGTLKFAASTDLSVAQKQGMFGKNGLDVTLVEFRNGQEAISAQKSGAVDILLAIPGVAMQANERGFDLIAVAQNETSRTSPPDSGSIVVLKDSPYRSLADLSGKRISVSGLHGQQTIAAQFVLQKAGVDISKVDIVETPTPSQPDLLKSKQVDAVVTVDPYTTMLQTSGLGRVVSWHFVESVPEQPIGVWYATSVFAKNNPQAVEAFARTMREAIQYMNEDEDRARRNVAEYTGLDPNLLKTMPLPKWDYRVKPDRWQAVIDMMLKMGELQKPHTADQFMSDQIKAYIVN
jgi:NitT/TauT family transport system substrate-binding protein